MIKVETSLSVRKSGYVIRRSRYKTFMNRTCKTYSRDLFTHWRLKFEVKLSTTQRNAKWSTNCVNNKFEINLSSPLQNLPWMCQMTVLHFAKNLTIINVGSAKYCSEISRMN